MSIWEVIGVAVSEDELGICEVWVSEWVFACSEGDAIDGALVQAGFPDHPLEDFVVHECRELPQAAYMGYIGQPRLPL